MQYRKFGKLDWKVSALGFGAMRLPLTDKDPAHVDEPETIRLIRCAIDHGVNYVDTAYPYHSGQSERVVGRALKDGYRNKIKLATKLPAQLVKSAQDFDRYFNEQLERLQTDKIDFYLLHGLNGQRWPKVRDLGVISWAENKMAKGCFDYLGFSFHDEYDAFKPIVDGYDNWTFCQVHYNYMDVDYQAGRRGVEYAASKGMGVAIMEPLRGGLLSRKPPEQVARVWQSVPGNRSPVEWALLWIWNQPEVSVALSGMNAMDQVIENVAVASRSGINKLNADDLALIGRAREAFRGLGPIPCTNCKYCMPCPNGVAIPNIFAMYNEAMMYNDLKVARSRYHGQGPAHISEEQSADNCKKCGQCIEACPQKMPIPDWLEKAHTLLIPNSS